MPERIELNRELEALHMDLIKMGALIEKQLDDTVEALTTQNADLAREVIAKDDIIDALERKIESECILLIARQQPIASDLRDIASILKLVSDLERIGDHCEDISSYTILLSKQEYVKTLNHIPEMAEKVKGMVKDVIDCTIKKDHELALQIIERDKEINEYFDMIVENTLEMMIANPENIRQGKEFLFIIKYFERMGDHSKNIANWIIYNITGHHAKYNM